MPNELFYFSMIYYVRQNFPKKWKSFLLKPIESSDLPDDFMSWWQLKKNEIYLFYEKQKELGIQITYPGRWDYPNCFIEKLEDPPLLLFYFGSPVWLNRTCIAVVGSRKMTVQSKKWLEDELHLFLKESKMVLVSGGARGVDQEAHYQSLRLSLPTIVALPSGLNKLYPSSLLDWKVDIIAKGGVFISEYFPDETMKSYHFIQRNRLIATLGSSVLIVQGEKRSGTFLTAKLALDLGQNLGVVPAHPMDSLYSGNQELLRWGVNPIIDNQDLKVLCGIV
jgi:DNA processing protein